MRLVWFEIENFRTIHVPQEEYVEVGGYQNRNQAYQTPFRIDPVAGINLLVGPNGVGKSNVLSAIYFALTPQEWDAQQDNRNRGSEKRTIKIKTIWQSLLMSVAPISLKLWIQDLPSTQAGLTR